MNDPFDELPFEEQLDPKNWPEEITLHTATFEATIKPDGTLWLKGAALHDGFSVEAAEALTRFLSEHVKVTPLPPPDDFEGFQPQRVEE